TLARLVESLHPPSATLFPYTTLFRSIRIDRVDAVLLVDHRAPRDPPRAVALLHPVEEAAAAHRVDFDAVEPRAHVDRHAGLRDRSEEHTSELQSPYDLVCRLLLEKKN